MHREAYDVNDTVNHNSQYRELTTLVDRNLITLIRIGGSYEPRTDDLSTPSTMGPGGPLVFTHLEVDRLNSSHPSRLNP